MELTIFAKKRQSNDGRTFFTYLTTLRKKDGTDMKVQVKFRQDCGQPKGENCPCIINVTKANANLAEEKYEVSEVNPETGEVKIETRKTFKLWVSDWTPGREYVDTSLDDFGD